MDTKNSMLLANMMSSKGGGVEFKTYCYAQNNGCILVDKAVDGFRVVGVLANVEKTASSYESK